MLSAYEPIISRHRLPRFYRISLTTLWTAPIGLLVAAILIGHGFSAALFEPQLLLPLLLMCIPAVYVWQEGIDVLPGGIVRRIHWPRYYAYHQLDNWYFDHRADRRVLKIWDAHGQKALECRSHLTNWPNLLAALKANLRYRNWPS